MDFHTLSEGMKDMRRQAMGGGRGWRSLYTGWWDLDSEAVACYSRETSVFEENPRPVGIIQGRDFHMQYASPCIPPHESWHEAEDAVTWTTVEINPTIDPGEVSFEAMAQAMALIRERVADLGDAFNEAATQIQEQTTVLGHPFVNIEYHPPKYRDCKARTLLVDHLDSIQQEEFGRTRSFVAVAPSGTRYRIQKGYITNVLRIPQPGDMGAPIRHYCLTLAKEDMSVYDLMLAQKFMIECDEEKFLKMANQQMLIW